MAFIPDTPEKVDGKVSELKKYIITAAVASAAGGAIPVPGVSAGIDLSIFSANILHQMNALGLDKRTIELRAMGYNGKFWKKSKFLEEVQRQIGEEDRLVSALLPAMFARGTADIGLIIPRLLLLIPGIIGSSIVEEASRLIPIVGSIVGGALSAVSTYYVLMTILKTNKKIANAVNEILKVEQATLDRNSGD